MSGRRIIKLPLSITLSEIIPERETSWMKEQTPTKQSLLYVWKCVAKERRHAVIDHQKKNVSKAVTNCITGQMAEFYRGPNLSSPIKTIVSQQSGLIAH